jgi:hypothetical protein
MYDKTDKKGKGFIVGWQMVPQSVNSDDDT